MNPPPQRPDGDIADPNAFFGEEPALRSSKRRPEANSSQPIGDGYEIEGGEPEDVAPPPREILVPKRTKPSSRPDGEERVKSPSKPIPEPSVSVPWNRMGEWGSTLIVLALVGMGTLFLANMALSRSFGSAFLVLLVGGAAFVALSYPISVTLERPVRMTPEQALKDYYAAASHHFPQYRRMWLLLSDPGKTSREYDSFATFRSYWKHRMNRLRGNAIKSSTPLTFVVGDYRGDKSAGKTSTEGSYSLAVGPRGGEATMTFSISTSFAKGPDGMWYLNEGALPEAGSTR